ncbi:hypothetical protein PS861_04686 [Pseudomonas fluorescens]|nr:hypothetical protein PS861_04686 [Pseudomonas fluorescens]
MANAKSVIGNGTDEKAFSVAMQMNSRKMLRGEASDIDLPNDMDDFMLATGSGSRVSALERFNGDLELRSRMARNNADSLAGFAMSSILMFDRAKKDAC